MLFKIVSITHGWFEVDFNRQFILTSSDFMGCDAPALFLNALGELFENKAAVQWLCWQDEPGAYILRLERDGERLIIEIFDTVCRHCTVPKNMIYYKRPKIEIKFKKCYHQ